MSVFLGVDVGQQHDPSALVAVGRRAGRWIVLGAEERPRGEQYADLVDAVETRCRTAGENVVVPVVDETGVGRPVVEALRVRQTAVGITLTGGARHGGEWPSWNVPKALLLHVASVGVECGRVVMPPRRRWPQLHEQLGALTRKPSGRVEARGSGHDDLALAWLYAVYAAQIADRPTLIERLGVEGGQVVAR